MKKKLTCMLLIFAVLFSGCASASEGEMPGIPAALEQEPVSETISAEEGPASETISAEEGSASETISAEEGPASETISAEEGPVSETISAEEEPASETISAEEGPASETISVEEEPASETISAEEEPASETISAEEEPASEAAAAETPVSDPAADANPTAGPELAPAADFRKVTDHEPGGEMSGTSAGGEQRPAKEQEITESAADDSCFESDAAEADSESGEDRFEDDAAEADSESEENGFEDADPAGCGEMQEGQSAGDASVQGEADGKGLPAAAASSGQGTPLGVITEKLDTDTPMTAILAGISAENKEKIVKEINDYIEQFVQNNLGLKIEDPILPDAEKYYVNGYDKSLCWAAVAANMLWTSNLAQVSTNPATGVPFQNVDEVFDYFRGIFTDLSGRPDGALAVFLKGASAYPFTSSRLSQLKNNDVKALVPEDIKIPDYGAVNIKGDINEISRLEKLAVQSLGVLLHSYDTFEEKMGKLAHWVTSPGIIIDETASGTDRYKAIVIADSDNDKVGGDGSIPDAEKAEKAAKATNSYTIYPLKLKTYGNIGQRWTIPFYTNEALSKFDVVIDWISYLGVIPPQKKEAEESVGPEDDDDEWDDDGWDEDDWDYDWEYDEPEEDDGPVVPSDPVQPAKPDQSAEPEPADNRDGQDNRDGDDWQYDETPVTPDDSVQPVIPGDIEDEDSSDDWFDDGLTDFNWDDMDWKEYEEFMDRLIKTVRQADRQTDDDGFFTDVKNWMAEKNLDVYSITDWNYSLAKDKTFLIFVRTDPSQLLNVLLDGRLLTSYLKNYEVIDKNTGTFLIVISSDVMQKLKAGDHRLTLEINGIGEVDRTIRVVK